MITYLIGLFTLPIVGATAILLLGLFERGVTVECVICDHYRRNGTRLRNALSWMWHMRFGCTVRGRRNRRNWPGTQEDQ